jgi:hypothetical protein
MVRANVSQRWPGNPADLGRAMADPRMFASLFPDSAPNAWADFEAAYAAASPAVARMAADQAQLEVQRFLQENAGSVPPKGLAVADGPPKRGRVYNKRAPGVQAEGVLPPGEFPWATLAKVVAARETSGEALLNAQAQLGSATLRIHNAMGERVPSEGGFLVPENLRDILLTMALEKSIVRPRSPEAGPC